MLQKVRDRNWEDEGTNAVAMPSIIAVMADGSLDNVLEVFLSRDGKASIVLAYGIF